jgi:hypothetical protein
VQCSGFLRPGSFIISAFYEELKRRKVLRFAVAYIMAGGFIIQIGSAVFPTSDLPNWSLRLLPNRAGQSRIYLT